MDAQGFVFPPRIEEWQAPEGRVVHVSSQIRAKREMLGTLKRRLGLRDLYGWNWDALYDSMRSLTTQPSNSTIVLIHDGLPFGGDSTKHREIYLEILDRLVNETAAESPTWVIAFPESCRDEVRRIIRSDLRA